MNKKYYLLLLTAAMFALTPACKSTADGTKDKVVSRKSTEYEIPATSIAELIRRKPNVTVTGSGSNVSVQIRGQRSFNATNEPLYVLDGRILGNDYSYVANLNPGDVSRIEVISDPATLSSYGSRGANGVIAIHLKSSNSIPNESFSLWGQ